MSKLNVYYSVAGYQSHKRVATAYRSLMEGKYKIVTDINDAGNADIIVLHHEPHNYASLYNKYPALKDKYVIGYWVWEASDLPESYKRSVDYVHEVWTPSRYCCDIFAKYHPNVVYMPHPIDRDIDYSDEDRVFAERVVDYQEDCVYFLSIARVWDRRKNIRSLVEAFQNQREKMPKARLIVKVAELEPADFINSSQIIYLPLKLTDSQLNALYGLSHIYVSAHHSEGWGLTLSDAMLFNKLVVGTGYSGNLEFMDESNSILVGFTEEYIRPEDQFHLFTGDMKWAYPKQDDLEEKLLFCYEGINEEWVAEKTRKALAGTKRFDHQAIGNLIAQRFDEIAARVRK